MPEKACPGQLIRGGNRFSDKDMHHSKHPARLETSKSGLRGRGANDAQEINSAVGADCGRTDQLRLGAHVSSIALGAAKLGLSSGWMRERGGWYATGNIDFSF